MSAAQRLGSADAAWLHMDRPTNLMVINSLLLFEQPVDFARLRGTVQRRLIERYPRFRQRVRDSRLPLLAPSWEEDPDFSIDHHMHHLALPSPGDELALRELVADMIATPLDRARPLWNVYLIDGYGRGCAVAIRMHHCIADGIALARVMLSLTDSTRRAGIGDARPAATEAVTATANATATTTTAAADADDANANANANAKAKAKEPPTAGGNRGARRRMGTPLGGALTSATRPLGDALGGVAKPLGGAVSLGLAGGRALLQQGLEVGAHPRHAGELAGAAARDASTFVRLVMTPSDAASALKGDPGVSRHVAWTRPLSLKLVKRIAHDHDATVNDVLLAAVSGALRRHLQHGEEPVEEIQALVPFNLRPLDEPVPRELGNRFGLVFLPLPVGAGGAYRRLVEVHRRMDRIKSSREGPVSYGVLSVVGLTPASVEKRIVDVLSGKSTAVMTNVPGPRKTVYLAGTPVRTVLVWAPTSGRVGMSISIFSYRDEVTVGLMVDAARVADPSTIAAQLERELDELAELPPTTARALERRAAGHASGAAPAHATRKRARRSAARRGSQAEPQRGSHP